MLLTFEGIDGSGKSTQARLLVEHLEARGGWPLLVREPGGTALSEHVRALLLDPALAVDPVAELLLFSAARAQLCAEVIRPALEAGRVVICDRFYDSTTAYQGAGRTLDQQARFDAGWLEALHRRVTGGLVPDRTYLVRLAPEAARQRRRGAAPDRMETADAAFYARVAAAYDRLAEVHPERFLTLDGTCSIAALHERIRRDVEALRARRHVAPPPGTAGSGAGSLG